MCLRFFIWAGVQKEYRHSTYMYNAACKMFKIDKNPNLIKDVIEAYRAEKCGVGVKSFKVVLGLCKEGKLVDEGLWVLRKMGEFGCRPDTIAYNSVIRMFCEKGRVDEGLRLMEEMGSEGVFPDMVTFVTLVKGFCDLGRIEDATKLFKVMNGKGCSLNAVAYSALDGICRAGKLEKGLKLLVEMENEGGVCAPTVVTYTSLIHSFCENGRSTEALTILDRMEAYGCAPNRVTISTFINGLCKEDKVDEANKLIDRCVGTWSVSKSECYSSLVVALLRVGKFDEAENVFRRMLVSGLKPDGVACSELLKRFILMLDGLCTKSHSLEALKLAKLMAQKSIRLKPPYIKSVVDYLKSADEMEIVSHIYKVNGNHLSLVESAIKPLVQGMKLSPVRACAMFMFKEATYASLSRGKMRWGEIHAIDNLDTIEPEDADMEFESEAEDDEDLSGRFCPALSKAVKTMKKGEKDILTFVLFTNGFGEEGKQASGNEGGVPPNATLQIALELVSWKIVSHVTTDIKVVKTILKEGEGYERPNEGAVVQGLGSQVLLVKEVDSLLKDLLERRNTFHHQTLSRVEERILCLLPECCTKLTSAAGAHAVESYILKALQELVFQELVCLFRSYNGDIKNAARVALLQIKDGRSGKFVIGDEQFSASLFDFPTILESYKIYDDNVLIKTTDYVSCSVSLPSDFQRDGAWWLHCSGGFQVWNNSLHVHHMFSVTTPMGIVLGMVLFLMTGYDDSNPNASIMEGLLGSSSSGILIYMGLVDLIALDFFHNKLSS
ncbi:pentatricopeptide repeat-containing protein [Tanacetum coccineum]